MASCSTTSAVIASRAQCTHDHLVTAIDAPYNATVNNREVEIWVQDVADLLVSNVFLLSSNVDVN